MKEYTIKGTEVQLVDTHSLTNKLPVGVYEVNFSMMSGFSLNKIMDGYSFPYKIYELDDSLINRVEKTWNSMNKNLGILLNGEKGSGKTVTAKLICNKLNLPVIILSTLGKGYLDFVNSIPEDIIIFLDEYEKIGLEPGMDEEYGVRDSTILQFMDGNLTSNHKRCYLLTTNKKYVNENLLQRPSRIRYSVEYGNLKTETIEKIVDDLLIYPEYRDSCIEFISQLETITIDTVKEVLNEVNIHNEDPKVFESVFNVQRTSKTFDIYEYSELDDTYKLYEESVTTNFKDLSELSTYSNYSWTGKGGSTNFKVLDNDVAEEGILTVSIYDRGLPGWRDEGDEEYLNKEQLKKAKFKKGIDAVKVLQFRKVYKSNHSLMGLLV